MLRRSARILSRASPYDARNPLNLLKRFSTKTLTVKHDTAMKIFYVELAKEKAVINYEKSGKNILDLYHTEVPEVFRGLGVAKVLAKAAFDHCVENDMKMKLSCDYLQKYYQENSLPEYRSRVIETVT